MNRTAETLLTTAFLLGGLVLAFGVSEYNFLLFHFFAELFAVAIVSGMFFVAWNCRKYVDADYFPFIGTALMGPAFLDLLHLLAYKGMPIFSQYGANLPTELWIQARYMQAAVMLTAPLLLDRKINLYAVAAGTGAVTLLLVASAYLGVFPDCFVEGSGLTTFKIASEYIICLMTLGAMAFTWWRRHLLDPKISLLLQASMGLTVVSELYFTFYVSVFGISNVMGHLFKIGAYFFLYRAAISVVLRDPMSTIFSQLRQREESLLSAHQEFLAVLEGLEAAIYVVDIKTYTTLFANRYLRQRLGPREIETEPCWKGIQGQSGPCPFCTIPELLDEQGDPSGVKTWEYLHPLTENWFLAHDRILHWPDGRLARLQVAMDIDSIKEAESLRDDIDSILRHDLKNPVNGILGMCKLLNAATSLTPEQQEFVDLIQISGENLLDLVNKSLDLHKIERGVYEFSPEPVDVDELLSPVIATNRSSVSKSNIIILHDPCAPNREDRPRVLVEPALCRTAFSNIIGNAVEATPRGGQVTVKSCIEDGFVRVDIHSPSVIPEEIRDRFAEKFVSSGKFGGTGLGAYSARLLTEFQGGSMSWQSSEEEGTVISLFLPRASGK